MVLLILSNKKNIEIRTCNYLINKVIITYKVVQEDEIDKKSCMNKLFFITYNMYDVQVSN